MMEMPKKVSIAEEPGGQVFIYRWRDWGFILFVPFGLVFSLIPLWIGWMSAGDLPAFIWIFLLLFSAIGVGLTYWSLGRVINRSEIRLQNGVLSVDHKPLPWRYRANLPAGDIQAISQETYYNRSRSESAGGGFGISFEGSYRNERLSAFVRNPQGVEKRVILIPKLELAAAQFLAQQIETRLGLSEELTPAEQEISLQEAKQEQRRVEARQATMLIPLLMLVIPLLIVAGAWMLVSTFNAQRLARASLSWPSVVGEASGYTIYENQPGPDDNWSAYFDANMEYTYAVNGQDYAIEKPVLETFATGEEMEQFIQSNYPPGAPLTVYYNPQKPAQALFDRSAPGALSFAMVGIIFICGLVAFFVLLFVARENCRAEGCPDAWKHWSYWWKQMPVLGRVG